MGDRSIAKVLKHSYFYRRALFSLGNLAPADSERANTRRHVRSKWIWQTEF